MPASEMRQFVESADIAVGILLNADGTDVEYVPLCPFSLPESTVCALEVKWAPRYLRFVGVMAWSDGAVRTQFEPLPEAVRVRLNAGFDVYLALFSAASNMN